MIWVPEVPFTSVNRHCDNGYTVTTPIISRHRYKVTTNQKPETQRKQPCTQNHCNPMRIR